MADEQSDNTAQIDKVPSGEPVVATISRDELKSKIDRQDTFLLVETLSKPKYREGHLPGALNLPPDRIAELAPVLLPDKNADIVVYCASPT
jgi:rhodanese-related sulfurtransferase